MRFLFWNTKNNPKINNLLSELIIENSTSFAVLAEYAANANELCNILEQRGIRMYIYPSGFESRLTILGMHENVVPMDQTVYESIQYINKDIVLCCVHLPSKIFTSGRNRCRSAIHRIIGDIHKTEIACNTKNTIVVGDFNLNPYEEECMGFEYFHGLPFTERGKDSREIAGEKYEYFYNPMWNFLGDFQKPYGTFYYSGSDTYWNILDQVIIRPALKNRFRKESLRIIDYIGKVSLLTPNGCPDSRISDHLPIVFELEDKREQI